MSAGEGFTLSAVVEDAFDEVVVRAREALGAEGFGVLTEIDLSWTFQHKLGIEVPRQTILGVCRAELAHRAVTADPSVATLLPCTVVVRDLGEGRVLVETMDPAVMGDLGGPAVAEVSADVRAHLSSALAALQPNG